MTDTQSTDHILEMNTHEIEEKTAEQPKEVSTVVSEKQSHPRASGEPVKLNKIEQLDKTASETLLALLSSKTQTEAAERLQIERSTLWYRVKKYKLDDIIAQIPREALMRLQLASTSAAEKLVQKLDDRKEGLQAAIEILDRTGVTARKDDSPQVQVNTFIGVKKEDYGI